MAHFLYSEVQSKGQRSTSDRLGKEPYDTSWVRSGLKTPKTPLRGVAEKLKMLTGQPRAAVFLEMCHGLRQLEEPTLTEYLSIRILESFMAIHISASFMHLRRYSLRQGN